MPAQAARARTRQHHTGLPALAKDLRKAVRAPHRHQVHDAAALDQDHVLAQQMSTHVRNARLGKQPQDAELDVSLISVSGRVKVDRFPGVADRRRYITQPRPGSGIGEPYSVLDQARGISATRNRLQDPGVREYLAADIRHVAALYRWRPAASWRRSGRSRRWHSAPRRHQTTATSGRWSSSC